MNRKFQVFLLSLYLCLMNHMAFSSEGTGDCRGNFDPNRQHPTYFSDDDLTRVDIAEYRVLEYHSELPTALPFLFSEHTHWISERYVTIFMNVNLGEEVPPFYFSFAFGDSGAVGVTLQVGRYDSHKSVTIHPDTPLSPILEKLVARATAEEHASEIPPVLEEFLTTDAIGRSSIHLGQHEVGPFIFALRQILQHEE